MADGETTKKLTEEVEHALHTASGAVESTINTATHSIGKVDKKLTEEASGLQRTLESILGGKKRFWIEQNVDGRRLATNMVGWGTFGLAVHAWHRGIQRTQILARPLRPYFIAFPVWAVLGYYIHHFELRQEETIAYRRLLLQRNRGLLEEEDLDALRPGQREQHQRRLSAWLGKDGEDQSAVMRRSTSEMESYKANLRERLDQFQKDFDESTLRRIHSEERRSRMALTPYMDEFGKEVSPRFAPRPRSEESRRGFFGRKKEPKSERLEDEVERALA